MQQGLCALCGCTVTQSACELDHVAPVRQLFADSVQRLQALCVDCRRRSGNPRSPRVWRAASARGLWRPTCAVRSCRRWSSRGLLKTRPFMQRLGFIDATYCLYGTPFKKQTRFWTNMRWAPSCGLCGPGNRCEAWENGRHARAAQRGPRKIGQRYENVRRQSRELLYSIPAALCDEISKRD